MKYLNYDSYLKFRPLVRILWKNFQLQNFFSFKFPVSAFISLKAQTWINETTKILKWIVCNSVFSAFQYFLYRAETSNGLLYSGLRSWLRCLRKWLLESFLGLLKCLDSSLARSWILKLGRNFLAYCLGKLSLLPWMGSVSCSFQFVYSPIYELHANPKFWRRCYFYKLIWSYLISLYKYLIPCRKMLLWPCDICLRKNNLWMVKLVL